MRVAFLGHMTMDLKVLKCGNCEELKLGVHAITLGLAALCGLYNAAAWLSRREQHLALNAVMYAALIGIRTAPRRPPYCRNAAIQFRTAAGAVGGRANGSVRRGGLKHEVQKFETTSGF
jgi:hypothetical protein